MIDKEELPTTKNDLGVSSELEKNSKKLDGELDCILRADARKAIIDHQYSANFCEEHNINHSINTSMALIALSALPSVTPQEPIKPMVEIDLYSVIKQKYIEREVLDKIDEVITDALDKSTDQKESQTLRWVLDKISEMT